jgi:hypothetical protein
LEDSGGGDAEAEALLSLLDDEDPQVRRRVAGRLGAFGADWSERLAARSEPLSARRRLLLSGMLADARRRVLAEEWLAPSGGAISLADDWEGVEALARLVSDFLHDGVSLRQALPDVLDGLAEDATEAGVETIDALAAYLFGGKAGFRAGGGDGMSCCDLCWVVDHRRSQPAGLALLFLFIARRLGVESVAARMRGRVPGWRAEELRGTNPEPASLLLRVLEILAGELHGVGRAADRDLICRLMATLTS